ncbi:MAG: hypothetical protein COA54_10905 [Thiotrichaceae bacterium]|nr:MAG: hypothetical protein COA54_10905 [Thiotrichaceae bacterium]
MEKKLKHKFLDAVITGKLGRHTDNGIIVTTKEFTQFFGEAGKKDYLRSYLPSVTIEAGRHAMQHNKYLFKMAHGIFRIHPDAIRHHRLNHKTE